MSRILKWTTNAYLIVVGAAGVLLFLAAHDALHPLGASALLVLICLFLPPLVVVLTVTQAVRVDFWQVALLCAVAAYVWIYAFAWLGWACATLPPRSRGGWWH